MVCTVKRNLRKSALICGSFLLVFSAAAADLSDPKAATKSVLEALKAKDESAVLATILIESADHQPLAGAMAQVLVAGRRMADAAAGRFGPAGDALGRGPVTPVDLPLVDQAVVEIKDGVADVLLPGQTIPLKFKRTDTGWRLMVTHFHGAAPENMPRQLALLRLTAGAMNEAATEIEQGRYATVEDAEAAIRQKMNFVLMRSLTATTVPTTSISD